MRAHGSYGVPTKRQKKRLGGSPPSRLSFLLRSRRRSRLNRATRSQLAALFLSLPPGVPVEFHPLRYAVLAADGFLQSHRVHALPEHRLVGTRAPVPEHPRIPYADEIAYPPALEITCRVNGELRQQSNTSLLITSIGQILEELTAGMTLLPGSIIATGTPAGVGMGFDPPKFLQSGDVVECAIEGIGTLRSTVV